MTIRQRTLQINLRIKRFQEGGKESRLCVLGHRYRVEIATYERRVAFISSCKQLKFAFLTVITGSINKGPFVSAGARIASSKFDLTRIEHSSHINLEHSGD